MFLDNKERVGVRPGFLRACCCALWPRSLPRALAKHKCITTNTCVPATFTRHFLAAAFQLIFLCLICTSCYQVHYSHYKDANVKAITVQPMFLAFPDAAANGFRTDLKVFGKTYRDVRGLEPYYINVPALDSILFVTGNNVGQAKATFYLVSVATHQVTKVDGDDSPFGIYIGWDGTYPPGATNYIASADTNGLVLVTGDSQKRVREYLDLRTKTLERGRRDSNPK